MAEVSGSAPKLCAACSKDVTALPRTKDAQGRYFCKECLAKLKAKAAAPSKPVEQDAVMAKLLADTPGVELCPNCGGGVQVGAKICIRCGFNKETGKAMRVQVERAPKEKGEPGALSKVGAAAAGPTALAFATLGALIGGGIGGAMWYGVAMGANRELAILAWLVGAITGVGAAAGARAYVGTYTGIIAVVVTLGAVIGAKYMVVENIVGQVEQKVSRQVVAKEEHAIGLIGRDVAKEHEAAGKRYQWPDEVTPDTALMEDDFPAIIWTEAKGRYDALDDAAKAQKRSDATAELRKAFKGAMNEVRSEGFAEMFSLYDILFFILAIGSAYAIGSGTKTMGEAFSGD